MYKSILTWWGNSLLCLNHSCVLEGYRQGDGIHPPLPLNYGMCKVLRASSTTLCCMIFSTLGLEKNRGHKCHNPQALPNKIQPNIPNNTKSSTWPWCPMTCINMSYKLIWKWPCPHNVLFPALTSINLLILITSIPFMSSINGVCPLSKTVQTITLLLTTRSNINPANCFCLFTKNTATIVGQLCIRWSMRTLQFSTVPCSCKIEGSKK